MCNVLITTPDIELKLVHRLSLLEFLVITSRHYPSTFHYFLGVSSFPCLFSSIVSLRFTFLSLPTNSRSLPSLPSRPLLYLYLLLIFTHCFLSFFSSYSTTSLVSRTTYLNSFISVCSPRNTQSTFLFFQKTISSLQCQHSTQITLHYISCIIYETSGYLHYNFSTLV